MHKKQPNSTMKTPKTKFWVVSAVIVGVITIIGFVAYFSLHNYAQDVAQPIESVLTSGGAIEVCSRGDPGCSPDNSSPYYQVEYEFNGTKAQAVQLITKAAASNGYKLTYQQSPYDYIVWYSDNTSKKSTYPGFGNGNIRVSFSLYSGGIEKLYCGKPVKADATHTAISFAVDLPSSH